jgi:hypothetical protein
VKNISAVYSAFLSKEEKEGAAASKNMAHSMLIISEFI